MGKYCAGRSQDDVSYVLCTANFQPFVVEKSREEFIFGS